jgi:[acyl-carrier-protein] S-malonyltransferase
MLAFVFPGQGSQYCGMGQDFAEAFSEARSVYDEADDCLGFSLSRLCFEGPAEDLVLTENTQPAILATSVAIWRIIESRGLRPGFVAGHSLGEYTALVAAGSLAFSDALRIVRQRGRFMQEAVPEGEGAMAAIVGLDPDTLAGICELAAEGEIVSMANLNSPEQTVIAGSTAAIGRAEAHASERGAKRVIRLPVSAPFHCKLMLPAQERLESVLEETEFKDLAFPLVNNVDAQAVRTAKEARDGLVRQVSSPVRWSATVLELRRAGVKSFLEIGPGRVLSGLIRRTDRSLSTGAVGKVEDLEAYV